MSHLQVLLLVQAEEKENHPAQQVTRAKQNTGKCLFVQLLSCDLKKAPTTKPKAKTSIINTFSEDSLRNNIMPLCFDLILLHPFSVSLIHLS